MNFEEGKCAGQCIWILLGIEIAEVSNIFITSGSLTLSADDHNSITDGIDTLASFIVWFGITMLQKPKSKLYTAIY